MEDRYLLAKASPLDSQPTTETGPNRVSPELFERLVAESIRTTYRFGDALLGSAMACSDADFAMLAKRYINHEKEGTDLGLFQPGGIRQKDHLLFWSLANYLDLDVYVESGVRGGSSLHGYLGAPNLDSVVAIDPDLSQLQLPVSVLGSTRLVDSKDFSQLDFTTESASSLVYFDDHIDAAMRIMQAHEKGFRFVVIDDAPGMEGMCQRAFPAFPTVPMIMRSDLLAPGDWVEWFYQSNLSRRQSPKAKVKKGVKKLLGRSADHAPYKRISFQVDDKLIGKCQTAGSLVKSWGQLPDLGEYIPQRRFEKMISTTKYILELHA